MPSPTTICGTLSNPQEIVSIPGSVGWVSDDPAIRSLIDAGAHVRIKSGKSQRSGSDTSRSTRWILSMPGRGFIPGRRLAEVAVTLIDAPALSEQMEVIQLTVFGPEKKLFRRERLFDGSVSSRAETLERLRELVPPQAERRLR